MIRMNISITTAGSDLTYSDKGMVEKKFSSLEKYADGGTLSCHVEQSIAVERSGAKYKADGNLKVDGKQFHASATSSTLEGAIDSVRDDLVREVKKAQSKDRNFLKRGGAALKRMLRLG